MSRIRDSRSSGQVIIEYILLLVVILSMATIIMKTMVSRSSDNTGFLIHKWNALLSQIAKDDPNKR